MQDSLYQGFLTICASKPSSNSLEVGKDQMDARTMPDSISMKLKQSVFAGGCKQKG